jgi:plastocyanin domain-containing protein
VVAITGTGSAVGRSVSSCTVGGVSASAVVTANASSGVTEIWVTPMVAAGGPTGTSATVAVNFSGAMLNAAIEVYAIKGASSTTASATASDTTSPLSQSLSIPNNGAAVAVARAAGTPGNTTWSGLTEDSDQAVEGGIAVATSASLEVTGVATPTVAASWGAGTATGLVAAAWAP